MAAAIARVLTRFVNKADRRAWTALAIVLAVLVARMRDVANVAFRLASTPLDPDLGILGPPSRSHLSTALAGQTALCVGCTKGVGFGIAAALQSIKIPFATVGRSSNDFAFDLSTVRGCHSLVESLRKNGTKYDLLFFTVGAWPDFKDPFTADGVEKVLALDLVARHVILARLVDEGLLNDGAVVVNTLASTQNFPFVNKPQIRIRLTSDRPPRSLLTGLFPIAVAADAWLPAAAVHYPSLSFAGVFPGIVVSDIAEPSLPSWAYSIYKRLLPFLALAPIDAGLNHLAIASAPQLRAKGVSYWNHLREGRRAHLLAYDPDIIAFVWDSLSNRSTTALLASSS